VVNARHFNALLPAGFTDFTPRVPSGAVTSIAVEAALRGPVVDGFVETIRAGRLGSSGSIASIAAQFEQLDTQHGDHIDPGPLQRVRVGGDIAVAYGTSLTRDGRPGHEQLVIVRDHGVNYAFAFTTTPSAYARDLRAFNNLLASVRWSSSDK
jgi:hypothetical protein